MPKSAGISPALTFVFALATGTLVANLYFAQALVTVLSPDLHLHGGLAGVAVTVTQLGYATGLLFFVSLADLVENRRLILILVAGTAIGLAGATFSHSALTFLISSLVFGSCAVAAQIIVPFAAALAPPDERGRVLGNVMAGLITGIMLARPVANFISAAYGWRAVFGTSCVLCVGVLVVLWLRLPERHPNADMTYGQVLRSTFRILRTTPLLQRRTLYQATMFAMFNLFWTAVPLVLSQRFGFNQRGIALFAFAGAGGALAAPIVGRLADRGWTWRGTLGAMLIAAVVFALAGWAVAAGSIALLALAAIALDAAMQSNQIISQRLIYAIDAQARGRINAIYATLIFFGGAFGSLMAGITYAYGAWPLTTALGIAAGLAILAYFTTEPRPSATRR